WCPGCGQDLHLADDPAPAPPAPAVADPAEEHIPEAELLPEQPPQPAPATAPAAVPSWRPITCVASGRVYGCRMEAAAPPSSPQQWSGLGADWGLWERAETALWPCPTCGLVQPDRVFRRKALWHGLLALGSFPVLGAVLVLGYANLLPADQA